MKQLSFWAESAARRSWNRLAAFLGKHNKIVTLLSAFIVFWSFIIKDAWDEHLEQVTRLGTLSKLNKDRTPADEQQLVAIGN